MNNQPELRKTLLRIAEDILSIGVLGVMAAALIFMIIAMADKNNKGEAPIGSFAVREFNQGWRLQGEGLNVQVELPARFDPAVGEVFLVNELPPDIGDGMSLMARGSMEDVTEMQRGLL